MPELEVTCSRCKSQLHHECHPETLQEAALDLFMWRPESGFPKEMKKHGDGAEQDKDVPFLTESFLYPLLGKEDARTLMALVNNVFRACGIEPHFLREKAYEVIDQKRRDKEAEAQRRAEARKRYHEEMLPVETAPQLGAQKGLKLCTYRSFYCFDVNVHACEGGDCFEHWNPDNPRTRTIGDAARDRQKVQMSDVTRTPEGELRVTCKVCKRIHRATALQVENWKGEKRYQVKVTPKEHQTPLGDPDHKPEDWIASPAIARALGFKRR
jgi:hypothetical protein